MQLSKGNFQVVCPLGMKSRFSRVVKVLFGHGLYAVCIYICIYPACTSQSTSAMEGGGRGGGEVGDPAACGGGPYSKGLHFQGVL